MPTAIGGSDRLTTASMSKAVGWVAPSARLRDRKNDHEKVCSHEPFELLALRTARSPVADHDGQQRQKERGDQSDRVERHTGRGHRLEPGDAADPEGVVREALADRTWVYEDEPAGEDDGGPDREHGPSPARPGQPPIGKDEGEEGAGHDERRVDPQATDERDDTGQDVVLPPGRGQQGPEDERQERQRDEQPPTS